ncbi:hypothetical protein GCM10017687_04810 [Streptomyces echinatus]
MADVVDGFAARVRQLAAPGAAAGPASREVRAVWGQMWDQAGEVARLAFEERREDALLGAHQALTWLYDQHLLTPDQGPVDGQFSSGGGRCAADTGGELGTGGADPDSLACRPGARRA